MIKSIRIPKGPFFRLEMVGSVNRIEGEGTVIVRDANSKTLAWIEMGDEDMAIALEDVLIDAVEAFDGKKDYTPDWSFFPG
jgi:hypothetical protein